MYSKLPLQGKVKFPNRYLLGEHRNTPGEAIGKFELCLNPMTSRLGYFLQKSSPDLPDRIGPRSRRRPSPSRSCYRPSHRKSRTKLCRNDFSLAKNLYELERVPIRTTKARSPSWRSSKTKTWKKVLKTHYNNNLSVVLLSRSKAVFPKDFFWSVEKILVLNYR